MEKLQILNRKQIKPILSYFEEQFGFKGKLDYVFLQNKKDKIFIINRDVERVDLSKMRVNSIGMYFAKFEKGGIRLSIEGSQLVGPGSKKNVFEADKEQVKNWLAGEDIKIEVDYRGFVIFKHNKDFFGCGKFKEGKLLNHFPKARRISSL